MDQRLTSRQRSRTRRRLLAAGAATAVHALLFLAFLSQAPPSLPPIAEPVVVLSLQRPSAPRPPLAPPRAPQRAVAPTAAATPVPPPQAAPSPGGVVAASPPTVLPAPSTPPPGDALSHALHAALGCAQPATLSAEERAHCAERLALAGAGRTYGIAPTQRAYFDAAADRALWWQKPFLAEIPKNGCAPQVSNHQFAMPGGRAASDWRMGIGCGKSF